jgi:hypothetical protein
MDGPGKRATHVPKKFGLQQIGGSAAQLTATNGPPLRGEFS